jgi:type II secretory pathway component PulF
LGLFTYKAVNRAGGHITGTIEAADRKGAVDGLLEKGQFVIELAEGKSASDDESGDIASPNLTGFIKFGARRIKGKDILAMTSQLSAALRAGLPLLNALEIICEQQHKIAMRDMLGGLVESVSSGESLSEAMAKYENIFNPLYLSMIRVGETGGILEETTAQLMGILERDEKIKTSMKNASAYPIFVLSLGIVSVIVIITWILPNILDTISGGEMVLPWPTKVLLALSSFLKTYGWLVAVVIAVIWVYLAKWTKTKGRIQWDTFKLRIPILGSVLRTIAVGRFARTLGALTKGGVSILESLSIVRDTLGNELLGRGIDDVAENVKAGTSLAEPLAQSGYFPPLLVQIISIGEQTGELDMLLLNAADTFDGEADAAITKFIAIFPAVLILLLALVIGFIIAATLLPIVIMELGGAGF